MECRRQRRASLEDTSGEGSDDPTGVKARSRLGEPSNPFLMTSSHEDVFADVVEGKAVKSDEEVDPTGKAGDDKHQRDLLGRRRNQSWSTAGRRFDVAASSSTECESLAVPVENAPGRPTAGLDRPADGSSSVFLSGEQKASRYFWNVDTESEEDLRQDVALVLLGRGPGGDEMERPIPLRIGLETQFEG